MHGRTTRELFQVLTTTPYHKRAVIRHLLITYKYEIMFWIKQSKQQEILVWAGSVNHKDYKTCITYNQNSFTLEYHHYSSCVLNTTNLLCQVFVNKLSCLCITKSWLEHASPTSCHTEITSCNSIVIGN